MRLDEKMEKAWIEVLAHIYNETDWKKIASSHNAMSVFERKLESCKYEKDVPTAIQKLCNVLGIQAQLPLEQVNILREHDGDAMRVLRKMPLLLACYARERAMEIRKERKREV